MIRHYIIMVLSFLAGCVYASSIWGAIWILVAGGPVAILAPSIIMTIFLIMMTGVCVSNLWDEHD